MRPSVADTAETDSDRLDRPDWRSDGPDARAVLRAPKDSSEEARCEKEEMACAICRSRASAMLRISRRYRMMRYVAVAMSDARRTDVSTASSTMPVVVPTVMV